MMVATHGVTQLTEPSNQKQKAHRVEETTQQGAQLDRAINATVLSILWKHPAIPKERRKKKATRKVSTTTTWAASIDYFSFVLASTYTLME